MANVLRSNNYQKNSLEIEIRTIKGEKYIKMTGRNDEKSQKPQGSKTKKPRRRLWDSILVVIGMTLGFIVIVMKITGYWPCDIAVTLRLKGVTCERPAIENMITIANSIQEHLSSIIGLHRQEFLALRLLLQSPHNIVQ